SVPRTLWSTLSASRRLSSTVWLSNTVGFWNLRPMPSSAMRVSSSRVRSTAPSNSTVPSSGLVLPVMMSIIVVLPAPFGPMMARISPGASVSDRLLMALKPSKATCTPSRYSSAWVVRAWLAIMRLLRHVRFGNAVLAGGTCGIDRQPLGFERLPPCVDCTNNALGQEQRHQNEQRAQYEQPVGRERSGGEVGLGVVDDDRAKRGSAQRAAAADRDPN